MSLFPIGSSFRELVEKTDEGIQLFPTKPIGQVLKEMRESKGIPPVVKVDVIPEFTRENFDLLVKRNTELRQVLQGIINGCCHPDIAVRAMMVELKPIREILKK